MGNMGFIYSYMKEVYGYGWSCGWQVVDLDGWLCNWKIMFVKKFSKVYCFLIE